MKPRSRKAILFLVIVSGVVVLVAAGFALKRPLLEQWFLWKLDSKELEERKTAAKRLGAMRSIRAVRSLVQILRDIAQTEDESPIKGSFVYSSHPMNRVDATEQYWREYWPARAIAAIGARGIPAIAEAIKDETWLYGGRSTIDRALRGAIEEMGPSAASHLMEMLDAKNPNTRRLAALVLRKLDHEPERALNVLLDAHRSAWRIGEFGSVAEDPSPRLDETLLRDEREQHLTPRS